MSPQLLASLSPSFAPSTAQVERPMENGIAHEALRHRQAYGWNTTGWPAPVQTPDNSPPPPPETSASPPLETIPLPMENGIAHELHEEGWPEEVWPEWGTWIAPTLQTPDYGNLPPPPPPELSASPPLSETIPLPDMAAPQPSQERTRAGRRNGA